MGKAPATTSSNPLNGTVPLIPWTRYRRKEVVASPQEDNQEEHRVPMDSIKRERKKKSWKGTIDNQKMDRENTTIVSGSLSIGKKKKKRQLPDSLIPSKEQEPSSVAVAPVVKDKTQTLLKQLMSHRPSSSSSSSNRRVWKPKLEKRLVEEEEEDEERAYTTQKRHDLKAQALVSSESSRSKSKWKKKRMNHFKEKESRDKEDIREIEAEEEEEEEVFHPCSHAIEQDVGVCRAVLSQLEDVAHANRSVIVIGDVECSLTETSVPISEQPTEPTTKDALDDFQMRIISMLRHSEALRVYHRTSFQQETSGFDAGAAYDFFKQRFSQVQHEEKQIRYSCCPEPTVGMGINLLEVVHVLTHPEKV